MHRCQGLLKYSLKSIQSQAASAFSSQVLLKIGKSLNICLCCPCSEVSYNTASYTERYTDSKHLRVNSSIISGPVRQLWTRHISTLSCIELCFHLYQLPLLRDSFPSYEQFFGIGHAQEILQDYQLILSSMVIIPKSVWSFLKENVFNLARVTWLRTVVSLPVSQITSLNGLRIFDIPSWVLNKYSRGTSYALHTVRKWPEDK